MALKIVGIVSAVLAVVAIVCAITVTGSGFFDLSNFTRTIFTVIAIISGILAVNVWIILTRCTQVKFMEACTMEKILRALEIIIGNCLVVFGVLALLKVIPVNVVMVFAFINWGVILLHSISSIRDKRKNK